MSKFYAVRKGRTPGIYTTWEECKAQVHGYSGAEYKKFSDRECAKAFLKGGNPPRKRNNKPVRKPRLGGGERVQLRIQRDQSMVLWYARTASGQVVKGGVLKPSWFTHDPVTERWLRFKLRHAGYEVAEVACEKAERAKEREFRSFMQRQGLR